MPENFYYQLDEHVLHKLFGNVLVCNMVFQGMVSENCFFKFSQNNNHFIYMLVEVDKVLIYPTACTG